MKNALRKFEMVRTFVAVGIALIVGFTIILLLSNQPLQAITNFVVGPLTKVRYMGNVIETAIPLIFSGLAVSLLFQAKLFNMGAEGIFYFSGLIAAIVGISVTLPMGVHPIVAILASGIVGALVMGIVGFFKARWDVSELVLSLMFNTILYGLGLYILNHFFREANTVVMKSVKIQKSALLHTIIPKTNIHSGLLVALIAVYACHRLLYRSKLGYEIRMTGANEIFAKYSGINTAKVIVQVSLIAGFLAGIGGGIEVLGMYDAFKWVALPGLGFDGALIAMLAKNDPKRVVVSALFLAYIRIGADLMSRLTDIPAEMVGIMQGLIILFISGRKFLQFYRNRLVMKEVQTA
ncbi:ABC transporter permease [Erysipelothrix urinaevulpis]|uniref:ABC transporter permease n=1 Tax=Erysipelothrix urinaevulpis TaxID=2683717 RepID=UPI0013571849|nr:ABC transporter permease [Erysipelothrix urinaevulpis]